MTQDARLRKSRLGADVSTKQIHRAAADGRKIVCSDFAGNNPVSGYVIGLDDFHILLGEVVHSVDGPVMGDIVLVHKSSPLVRVSRVNTLRHEPDHVQAGIRVLGGPFAERCRRTLSLSQAKA